MKKIWMLAICLGISSLAAAQNAKERKQNIRAAESACGDPHIHVQVQKNLNFHAPPPIESGKARVYVIESKYGMLNPTILVGMDGTWMGATKGNAYITFSVDPGEHHLCVAGKPALRNILVPISLEELSATANHTYYFQTTLYEGYYFNIFDLESVNPDEARLLLTESTPVVSRILIAKKAEKQKHHP